MTAQIRHLGSVPNGVGAPELPRVPGQAWKLRGLCNQSDPEAWYPDHDGDRIVAQVCRPGDEVGKAVSAKAICFACPVRLECLQAALDNREQHGIWGGMTVRERRLLMRKRTAS